MSKGIGMVVIFSVCLIVVFFVMIYLMTTINPPPLEDIDVPDRQSENVSMGDRTDTTDAMEKIESEEIDFYQSTPKTPRKYMNLDNDTGVFRYLHRKVIPPLWPRDKQTIIVDPTMHIVMPPDWPNNSERTDPTPIRRTKPGTVEFIEYRDDIRPKHKLRYNITATNPMKRRSINNFKLNNNSGPVILKILDGKGNSMIEIKLVSNENTLKNISNRNHTSSEDKSNFTIQLENNGQRESNKLVKSAIMTIMSNDSIVIDELDTKSILESGVTDIRNITDLISLMVLVSSKNKNSTKELKKEQIKTNNTTKVPLYESNVSQEVMFNNKTTPSRRNVASSPNINEGRFMTALKNSTVLKNYTKDSTHLNLTTANGKSTKVANNAEYDNKFNNTEFMKMLFNDDVAYNIKTTNHKNHTVLFNDTAFSNYTDEVSENDADNIRSY